MDELLIFTFVVIAFWVGVATGCTVFFLNNKKCGKSQLSKKFRSVHSRHSTGGYTLLRGEVILDKYGNIIAKG